MTHRRPWRETITEKTPLQFDALDGEILDLRSCCLSPSSTQPMQLRCVVDGQEALTVARVSPGQPSCRLAARFTGKTTLAVRGQGELCLGGLLFSAEAKVRGTKRVSPDSVSQDIRPAKQAAPAKQAESAKQAPAKQAPAKSPKQAPAKQVEQQTQSKSPVQAPTKSPQVKPAAVASPKAKPAEAKPAKAQAAVASPKAKPAEAKPAKAQTEAVAPSALTPEELKTRAKAAMERRAAEAAGKAKPAVQAEAKPEESKSEAYGKGKKKKKQKEATPLATRATTSGLQIEVMKAGSGREALLGHPVKVKYQGWLTDGTSFDKGEIKFRLGLGEVIVGWDEGVKGMRIGEERRLLVPPRLGYGLEGSPPAIPSNAKLVFQVQLLDC